MNISVIDRDMLREVVVRPHRRTWLLKHRWLLVFVGLPTVMSAIYFGLMASPIYVSQSSFVIKSPGQKGMPTLSLANLIQTSGMSSGQEQSKEVVQYIRSRDAVRQLQKQTALEAKFSNRGADFLSRFPRPLQDRTFESLYHYYSSMIDAGVDPETGLAEVDVKAFTPQDAYQINERLLELSESFVNRLNERAEGRAISEAERRVEQAQTRVRNARIAIGAYRNQQDLLDPSKQGAGVLDISNKLVSEQAGVRAQLDLMLRVAPRNPAIPALRNRVVAIGREIAAQNARAVGSPTGIASKLGAYEKLAAEQEFATQMLTAASAALEQARSESQKQQFYLERVVEPNRPDQATFPHRLKQVITIFAASLCLYFIGWMLVVGILEHAPEA